MKSKPKILDQLRNKIRRYNYSIRTEKAYVDLNKRFILFHNKKHPQEMGTQEIKDQRSGVGGPQLNSLRLSSSKNLTGQAEVGGWRAKDQKSEVGGPQLNSPQLNEYGRVSRGKLSLSSSKNLTGQAGIQVKCLTHKYVWFF
jgi:hypothetical protein